jgi:hypothetical protein
MPSPERYVPVGSELDRSACHPAEHRPTKLAIAVATIRQQGGAVIPHGTSV